MARILVIDDEHNIRMMIRLALQHDGHVVDTAEDGHAGLDLFNNGAAWDLVLLDQRMPGIEGVTVLKQLRYHDSNVRVIMVTAFGTVDLAVEAMKAGATDFLRKPFTTQVLRSAVQSALQHKQPAGQSGLTFGMTTINGFRIEFQPGTYEETPEGLRSPFKVIRPDGESRECTVLLSHVVMELVKAHVDREQLPGGARFWQALSEEALANYVYLNADFPPDAFIRVDEFTAGLKRFVEAVSAPA